jgi:hypothetical protein
MGHVAGVTAGVHPDGILDDILGGITKVVGTVAPVACSMCALIPHPVAKAACMAACSAVG